MSERIRDSRGSPRLAGTVATTRVRPETRATLERMATVHGSISRAVDHLAEEKNFPPISRGNAADCQS